MSNMRPLSDVTAPIIRDIVRPSRVLDRHRRAQMVLSSLTCMVLYRHQENPLEIFVSADGDATGAVWLHRTPILIDRKDRGNFLVVQLPRSLAQQKHLAVSLFDWDRYTLSEHAMLKDAVEAAQRIRMRLSGQSSNRPTWSGGRNVYA